VGNVKELVALAKSKPGKLAYGSFGSGTTSHLAGEMFKLVTGADILHVPYKGSAPAMTDLIGGQVQLTFDTNVAALPMLQAGKVKALAVTSAKRSPSFPEIPTAIESGMPSFEVTSWYGLWLPAGTPRPIVQKLREAVVKAFEDPQLRETWFKLGAEAGGATSEEFRDLVRQDVSKWARVVKEAGVKAE